MDYDDMIRKSIKEFLKGKVPETTSQLNEKGLRYTPDYFNDLEKELDEDGDKKPADKEDDVDAI
jgi:hypothetical protein